MNSKTKLYLDVLTAFTGCFLLLLNIFGGQQVIGLPNGNEEKTTRFIYIIAGLFLLAFVLLNRDKIRNFYHNLILSYFKNFLLNVNIQKQNGYLEFLDQYGGEAVYTEENYFTKARNGKAYMASIQVEGRLKDYVEAYNCSCNINHKRTYMEIIYGKFPFHNKHVRFRNQQYHFGYSIKIEDSFRNNIEWWFIRCSHFTFEYVLNMTFNKQNGPKKIELYEWVLDEQTKIRKRTKLNLNPLIVERTDNILVKVRLLNIVKGQIFSVEWEWDSNPNLTSTDPLNKINVEEIGI